MWFYSIPVSCIGALFSLVHYPKPAFNRFILFALSKLSSSSSSLLPIIFMTDTPPKGTELNSLQTIHVRICRGEKSFDILVRLVFMQLVCLENSFLDKSKFIGLHLSSIYYYYYYYYLTCQLGGIMCSLLLVGRLGEKRSSFLFVSVCVLIDSGAGFVADPFYRFIW